LEIVPDDETPVLARRFLFWRHPAMQTWPKNHKWMVGRLKPKVLDLLDFYGGAAHISLEDYWNADCH
jgi:hypothetical protein